MTEGTQQLQLPDGTRRDVAQPHFGIDPQLPVPRCCMAIFRGIAAEVAAEGLESIPFDSQSGCGLVAPMREEMRTAGRQRGMQIEPIDAATGTLSNRRPAWDGNE